MKIGLIITPFKEEELKKKEYIEISTKRVWLNNVDEKFIINNNNKKYVSDDIAVYYYLNYKYNKIHSFTYIYGNDLNIYNKVKDCDLVFLLIFDMVEAFHVLSKSEFEEMKRVFTLPHVYPPYFFQKFINHKNTYYDYLIQKNINVLPFIHISAEEFKYNPEKCVKKVMNIQRGDENKFIGKPIYGQERIDFVLFDKNVLPHRIYKYLERICTIYQGCIFQPYIKSLHKSYEYRIYYIGNKQLYTIRTRFLSDTDSDKFEQKLITLKDDKNLKDILIFSKNVFNNLPKSVMNGKVVDKLITRIDISCCYGKDKYFVSEVEFVPSLFTEVKEVDDLYIDKIIGDQIINISSQININTLKVSKNKNNYINLFYFIILIILLFFIYYLYKNKKISKRR